MIRVRRAVQDDFESLRPFDEWNVVTRERIDNGTLFLAEIDGAARAIGILDRSFLNRAFISILFVHPDHRGRGLGRALMEHFESITEDARLWVSTNIENLTMQRILHQRDYALCGVVDNLGKLPELFYMKELTQPT